MDGIWVKKDLLTGKKIVLTTEQIKYEQAQQQEKECRRQRRQVTLLEKKHDVLVHGTDKQSIRNKRVLKILRHEAQNILVDLDVATSEGKLLQDQYFKKKLAKQLHRGEVMEERVKEERKCIGEITGQINKLEKEVVQEQAKQVTDREIQERTFHGRNKLECMENKLEVQTIKFGVIMTENQKLRDEINHLVKDRVLFNKMWEQYINNLQTGKKFMLDLIEMSTIAYDQREEWCSKLNALRLRAHNDYLRDLQDMHILRGKMNRQRRLSKFATIKSQARVMRDLYSSTKRKQQEKRQELSKKIVRYKNIMDKIAEFSNLKLSRLKEVAINYQRDDQENYGKLQYLISLNHETEQISTNIVFLNNAIDMKREQQAYWGERQKVRLEEFREELKRATLEADKAVEDLNNKRAEIKALLEQIDIVFNLIQCDRDPIIQLLGKNQKVHKRNVKIYLNVIENKIIELILNVYQKERVAKRSTNYNDENTVLDYTIDHIPEVIGVQEYIKTNPCPLCVQHQQVSDVIDIRQKVLNREEIQSNLQMKLERPEGAYWLHSVSACNLPESRQIIQRRYQ